MASGSALNETVQRTPKKGSVLGLLVKLGLIVLAIWLIAGLSDRPFAH